ncbi:hypothetical protein JTB14_028791 [Gonioctena quinquepunctata]|nr:hypothetical protein JTB14_028791 [Gonioctena quinquepunctata]
MRFPAFSSCFSFHLFSLCFAALFMASKQQEKVLAKDMRFKLNSGDLMPLVGFGTYQIRGYDLIRSSLDAALGAGYKLIDSATVYGNEQDIGKALKELLPKYNLTRKDIFITSKLAPSDQGEKAYKALELSLKNLDCEYIDLYLIHWPGANGVNASSSENSKLRNESWKQLVKGKKNGLTRNIGISNYNVGHMTELLNNNHGVKPAVNQIEWHPFFHKDDVLELCRKEGILLQAYSSLGGTDNRSLLDNPEVTKIAQRLGKTPAQVLLRWPLSKTSQSSRNPEPRNISNKTSTSTSSLRNPTSNF